MASRITIVMDDELLGKLRKIQSEHIIKENRNVAMSEVVNHLSKSVILCPYVRCFDNDYILTH